MLNGKRWCFGTSTIMRYGDGQGKFGDGTSRAHDGDGVGKTDTITSCAKAGATVVTG